MILGDPSTLPSASPAGGFLCALVTSYTPGVILVLLILCLIVNAAGVNLATWLGVGLFLGLAGLAALDVAEDRQTAGRTANPPRQTS